MHEQQPGPDLILQVWCVLLGYAARWCTNATEHSVSGSGAAIHLEQCMLAGL